MSTKTNTVAEFLQELHAFTEDAIVANEPCPEGHREDPGSGRCLPMGSIDHTAFTRSLNDDQGDEWRGITTKTVANTPSEKALLHADEMENRESCPAGTTFSFVKSTCVSQDDAEMENSDEFAMVSDTEYDEDVAAAPGVGGHQEIVNMDPEGRRDPINFRCPPKQLFDFKRRECIPLNKDTVMASVELSDDEKQELARYLSGKVAMTSPDPIDGHTHLATLDMEGNGTTSVTSVYMDGSDSRHSHTVADYVVKDYSAKGYTSRHFGHALPQEVYEYGEDDCDTPDAIGIAEIASPIKSKTRRALPDSAFGVPAKRKFPLDTCARIRNAMSRFNQAKDLTPGERASLRRKILARANECDIEIKNFAKATTTEEFNEVMVDLLDTQQRVEIMYNSDANSDDQGPCPPGMLWDSANRRCSRTRGFVDAVREQSNHSDIISKQPAGRRDTINHACPPGEIFDYKNRKCISLDPKKKEGTQPGDTTKASSKDLVPNPKGLPAKLPQDCPSGTIWDKKKEDCVPLDSSKKTKSSDEEAKMPDFIKKMMDKKKGKDGKDGKDGDDKKKKGKDLPPFMKKKNKSSAADTAQTTPNGNSGNEDKDDRGCTPQQFWNPISKKCQTKKAAPTVKADTEDAAAQSGNREGLTIEVPGKVKLPVDCPPGTLWDGTRRTCTPLSTTEKDRPNGSSGPMNPKDVASMSTALLIQHLDEIIKGELVEARSARSKVAAKSLPNSAFPPSLVSASKRSFMHHSHTVEDPYDNETVDVPRLRNALARFSSEKSQEGFSSPAVADGLEHLVYHARSIVSDHLVKKD